MGGRTQESAVEEVGLNSCVHRRFRGRRGVERGSEVPPRSCNDAAGEDRRVHAWEDEEVESSTTGHRA